MHARAHSRSYALVGALVYLELIQNSSSKSNQSCRQYPVDRLTRNYIPFWVKDRQRSKTIVQNTQSQEKFYNQIQQNFFDFNQLSYTELIIKLMNSQNFSVNSHLLKFVSLCNDLRNNLLSNHADDTWLTIVIIALHYHCYDLFVCFFFMLKILQYCNYIIKVMQIKLMLLFLLAM